MASNAVAIVLLMMTCYGQEQCRWPDSCTDTSSVSLATELVHTCMPHNKTSTCAVQKANPHESNSKSTGTETWRTDFAEEFAFLAWALSLCLMAASASVDGAGVSREPLRQASHIE